MLLLDQDKKHGGNVKSVVQNGELELRIDQMVVVVQNAVGKLNIKFLILCLLKIC